jgi:hypothetical protein
VLVIKGGIVLPSVSSYFIKKGIKVGAKKINLNEKDIGESRHIIDSFAQKFSRLPKNCKVEHIQIEGIYAEWISNDQNVEGKVFSIYTEVGMVIAQRKPIDRWLRES